MVQTIKRKPPKKRLKAQKVTVKAPKPPVCPRHQSVMKFDPDNLVWGCTLHGCSMIAHPKVELSSSKPIVGKGDVELIVVQTNKEDEPEYFLRSANNVMVNVTKYVSSLTGIQEADMPREYNLYLSLPDAALIDGVSKRPL